MHTCHACGAETSTPNFVYANGREGVPVCYPPCEASLRPKPVARAAKACTSCGKDVTGQDTYRDGLGACCLSYEEKELLFGDPVLRYLRRV